jgi:uncharacterized repeat protein (TIGR03847 family)
MHDFEKVETFEPEALGQPGHRTFRLRIRSGTQAASIWLEKEQLAALSLAVRQVLAQVSGGQTSEPSSSPELSPGFPEHPDVEFKVGRLGLGYDDSEGMVVLFAYTQEEDEDSPPSLTCRLTQVQCRSFSNAADAVVAAGRPLCPLCGGPIDPDGHICPRSNGHARQETPP